MPTGRQIRAACQYCHARGRFRPMEVSVSYLGVVHWQQLTFCAACRASWLSLTFGKQRMRAPAPGIPWRDLVKSVETRTDIQQPAARSRSRFKRRDLYRDAS